MSLITKKNILLTGAGFTANFGGLLAREMWAKIFNNPKTYSLVGIKELLRKNFDFESVYASVKNSSSFTDTDKLIFQDIVQESYASMDTSLKNYSFGGFGKFNINISGVSQLLGSFAGQREERGAHFTLNQDLFIERQTRAIPLGLPMYQYREYGDRIQQGQIDSTDLVNLPDEDFLNNFKDKHQSSVGDSCFIKLHGSIGWVSDGGSQMILGTNKLEDINKEPLLKWYFELFKEAISRPGVRLFIIGYGFRDQHVNDIILKAMNENNLKIYIISPEDPSVLKTRLLKDPCLVIDSQTIPPINEKIWDAVNGYFPHTLKDIFPGDQTVTGTYLDIKKILNL